jgi:hypothetical protein
MAGYGVSVRVLILLILSPAYSNIQYPVTVQHESPYKEPSKFDKRVTLKLGNFENQD